MEADPLASQMRPMPLPFVSSRIFALKSDISFELSTMSAPIFLARFKRASTMSVAITLDAPKSTRTTLITR